MTTTLTREQILQMPAGLELDRLVAEKVLGWRWRGAYLVPGELSGQILDSHQIPDVPSYSTDIAAAWDVVKLMHDRCWSLGWGRHHEYGKGWFVTDSSEYDFITLSGPACDNAPLAICRAALLGLPA